METTMFAELYEVCYRINFSTLQPLSWRRVTADSGLVAAILK